MEGRSCVFLLAAVPIGNSSFLFCSSDYLHAKSWLHTKRWCSILFYTIMFMPVVLAKLTRN